MAQKSIQSLLWSCLTANAVIRTRHVMCLTSIATSVLLSQSKPKSGITELALAADYLRNHMEAC